MKRGVVHRPGLSLLSTVDVGSMNRARVMRLLYASGPLTRAEMSVQLDVSRATIGTLVQPLLDNGALVELPALSVGEQGGKPAKPLWFGSDRSVGAIYLSSDECVVARVAMDGSLEASEPEPIVADDPESLMRQILALSRRVLGSHPLAGIGVAFAGMVDTRSGVLLANYRRPAIGLLPVREVLGNTFGVRVVADHHPRIQATGDAWFGLARQLGTFGSVITGEVLGVGMQQDGQTLRGVRGAGGEVGHIVVDLNGPQCLCGRRGCWETVATLGWLRSEAAARGLADPASVSSGRLVREAHGGDPVASQLLDNYAERLALGLANIEQLLGLGTYILHGEVVEGGELLRAKLERLLIRDSPVRVPKPQVLFADQPDNSTLLGAAGLVLANVYRARL